MASTNKTANLGLSQWEAVDPFTREDLNANLQKIDEAVCGRMRFDVLADLTIEPQNVSVISVDLNGANLSEYALVFVSTPSINYCSLYVSTSYTGTVSQMESGTLVILFPLKNGENSVKSITTAMGTLTIGTSTTKYADISSFEFVGSSDKFKSGGKIRITGVR